MRHGSLDRQAARRAHLVARRKAPDLSRWRRIDGCGSCHRQDACAGERGQDGAAGGQQRLASRTATIASATTWPAISGRRTPRTFSSTPTAACGFTTCTTARESRSAFSGMASGDDPKFSPDGHPSRSFAITAWPSSACTSPARPPCRSLRTQLPRRRRPGLSQRRSGLGLRRRARRAQQLLLVAGLKEHCLPADERNPGAAVSASPTGFPPTPTVDWQRYPQPGDPNPDVHLGVVQRAGGKTVWVKLPIHAGRRLHPALRLGRRQNALDRNPQPRSQASRRSTLPTPTTAKRDSMLEISDDKFLDENYDVTVGDGAIVLTNWSDGHNHIYLYSYDKDEAAGGRLPSWSGS